MNKNEEERCSSPSLSSDDFSDEEESIRSDSSRHRVKDLQRQTEKWAECTAEWRDRWEKMKRDRDTVLKKARSYKQKLEKTTDKVEILQDKIKELEEENKRLKDKLQQIESVEDEEVGELERRGTVRFRRRSEPAFRKSSTSTLTNMKDEGLGSSAESTSPPATPGGLDLSAFSLTPTLKIIEDLVSKHEKDMSKHEKHDMSKHEKHDMSKQEKDTPTDNTLGMAKQWSTASQPSISMRNQQHELKDDFSSWKSKKSALPHSPPLSTTPSLGPSHTRHTDRQSVPGKKREVHTKPSDQSTTRYSAKSMNAKITGTKSTTTRPNTSRSTERISSEDQSTNSQSTEDRIINSGSTEDRSINSRSTEDRSTNSRSTEDRSTNSRSTEDRSTNSRSTEDRSTNSRSTEDRSTNSQSTTKKIGSKPQGSFLDLASRKAMYTAAVMQSEKPHPPIMSGSKIKSFSHSQDCVTHDLTSVPPPITASTAANRQTSNVPSSKNTFQTTSTKPGASSSNVAKTTGFVGGTTSNSGTKITKIPESNRKFSENSLRSDLSDKSKVIPDSTSNKGNGWTTSNVSPITTPMNSPRPSTSGNVVTMYATRVPLRQP